MSLNCHRMVGCFITLIFLLFVSIHATKRGLRVAFGQVVEDPIPFQVSISGLFTYENGSKIDYLCGGTILNEYWIMTAAHCANKSVPEYYIFAGSNIQYDGDKYKVVNRTIHPSYFQITEFLHDIALFKIEKPIKYIPGRIEPAEWRLGLGGPTTDYGIATISGWGMNEHKQLLGFLQTTQQPLFPPKYCSSYKARVLKTQNLDVLNAIEKYMICTLPWMYTTNVRSTTCSGDSGSPLIFNNNIIGIVSHSGRGDSCPNSNYGFYTRVEPYVSWIKEVINQR